MKVTVNLSEEAAERAKTRAAQLKGVGPRVRYSLSAYVEELILQDVADGLLKEFQG
tara:strand:- start:62 stop:229 length:168 start_codon:yes stop_codon:yes gene_type:complete